MNYDNNSINIVVHMSLQVICTLKQHIPESLNESRGTRKDREIVCRNSAESFSHQKKQLLSI